MAIGSSIGGTIGGTLGTFAGGPIGTAIGTGLGAALGAGIEAIPTLMENDAEKENKRRLAQLQRMQEMGALGLTEAEKQSLFTGAQAQAAGQMRQAQSQIRAAGAALGGSGAGAEALRQAQMAEGMAGIQAGIARDVEAKDLERQRELEAEIQERIATKSDYDVARRQALAEIASAGLQAGTERFTAEKLIQGKVPTSAEVAAFAKMRKISQEEAEALLSLEAKRPGISSRYGSIATEEKK
jgi:hypothetical protein